MVENPLPLTLTMKVMVIIIFCLIHMYLIMIMNSYFHVRTRYVVSSCLKMMICGTCKRMVIYLLTHNVFLQIGIICNINSIIKLEVLWWIQYFSINFPKFLINALSIAFMTLKSTLVMDMNVLKKPKLRY